MYERGEVMRKKIKPQVGDICVITKSIFAGNIGKIVKVTETFEDWDRINVESMKMLHVYSILDTKPLAPRKRASVTPSQLKLLWRDTP
jgi:hypothetical protein